MNKKTFLMVLPAALFFNTASIADSITTSDNSIATLPEVTIDEFNKGIESGPNNKGVLTEELLKKLSTAIVAYENNHFNGIKIKDADGNEKTIKEGVSDKNSYDCSYNRTDKSVIVKELDGKLYAFNYWGDWYYETPANIDDIKAHKFRLPSVKSAIKAGGKAFSKIASKIAAIKK